ncbi:MAG: hypothetical protein O9972_01915 [Burkholderiales bacterium]|nr:hypothetical protein [Burkholderiales bacterium]
MSGPSAQGQAREKASRETVSTRQPSSLKRFTVAWPIPRLAPVSRSVFRSVIGLLDGTVTRKRLLLAKESDEGPLGVEDLCLRGGMPVGPGHGMFEGVGAASPKMPSNTHHDTRSPAMAVRSAATPSRKNGASLTTNAAALADMAGTRSRCCRRPDTTRADTAAEPPPAARRSARARHPPGQHQPHRGRREARHVQRLVHRHDALAQ